MFRWWAHRGSNLGLANFEPEPLSHTSNRRTSNRLDFFCKQSGTVGARFAMSAPAPSAQGHCGVVLVTADALEALGENHGQTYGYSIDHAVEGGGVVGSRAPFARIFEAMSHSAETFDCRSTVLSSRQRTPGKPLNRRYSGKAVESLEQGQHDCMRGAEDSRRSNRLR
jgi:hypothetical protein